MTLKQLMYFVAIARHGSFLKAAQQVYVAQSALSYQIAQLEDYLQTPLFFRSRQGVELTEAGEVFLTHAQAILRQVEDATHTVRTLSQTPEGVVTFGLAHSVSNALALPLLQEVRTKFPKIHLELTEELTGNLSRQLRSGQIHMAVLFDDGLQDDFLVQPILRERLSLISPAAQRPECDVMNLHEALTMPLILPSNPHGVRPIIEQLAQAQSYAAPNVVADISSISILRTSLLAGLGHTLLPVMPLQPEIDQNLLSVTTVESPALYRDVVLCRSAHLPLSTAASSVWQLCVNLIHTLSENGCWRDSEPL